MSVPWIHKMIISSGHVSVSCDMGREMMEFSNGGGLNLYKELPYPKCYLMTQKSTPFNHDAKIRIVQRHGIWIPKWKYPFIHPVSQHRRQS